MTLGLGFLLGLTFLARNDAVFFCVGLGLGHLFLERHRRAVLEVTLMASGVTVLALPWLVFNYFKFGSIVPQSGHAESLEAAFGANAVEVLRYLAGFCGLIAQIPPAVFHRWGVLLAGLALFAVLAAFVYRRYRSLASLEELSELRVFATLWIPYVALLVLFYSLAFGAPSFIFRFLFPVWMFCSLAIGIPLGVFLQHRWKSPPRFLLQACALFLVIATLAGYVRDFEGVFTNPWFHPVVQFTDWAKENLRKGEVIASNQTGMLGYFVEGVVNLDGKTNADALSAKKQGRYVEYLCRLRPTYFIEWPTIAEALMENPKVSQTFEVKVRKDGLYGFMVLSLRTAGSR